jgi:hypothetical protein
MTREDIISMAREAGIKQAIEEQHLLFVHERERFYELATAKEREARQAAQVENEELKARLARAELLVGIKDALLARAGLEQRRAVLAEREACAKVAEAGADGEDPHCCVPVALNIAAAIRARKDNT